jgi:gliding motility-associated-like protein
MNLIKKKSLLLFILFPFLIYAQDVSLYQQFNGKYDYKAFGNTLNIIENTGGENICEILPESSADFQLNTDQSIVAAYLYWAGSSSINDTEVSLNGTLFQAEREFNYLLNGNLLFFAAFVDITDYLTTNGNGTYTFSGLDIDVTPYCSNTTNFGGWAVTVIYEDNSLPLNQVNVFDGLESVSAFNNTITITLENLFVLDNIGAKIGFVAWEGDQSLSNGETLQINGNLISNPPLNPEDNAFNSSNSYTGSNTMYNMDIDFYSIENNINPGDTSATVTLTSLQDFVMINNIITVLNNELPDATIEIDTIDGGSECGDREIEVDYTVYNLNSTSFLPANTPIAFYANNTLIGQSQTTVDLQIGESESGTILLSIPQGIPTPLILIASVDDQGNGIGIVNELNEDNNQFSIEHAIIDSPIIPELFDLEKCDVFGVQLFNLNEATTLIDQLYTISYHVSETDAENNINPITNIGEYQNTSNLETIYIRVSNENCFVIDSFQIELIICFLPDATIEINNNLNACRLRDLIVDYTVYNTLGTVLLPAETNISFYINGVLITQSETINDIPTGGSENNTIDIFLQNGTPDVFNLLVRVDDNGTGVGAILELNDFNNDFNSTVTFGSIPPINELPDLLLCNEGFDVATFNLTEQNDLISLNEDDIITYYETEKDAIINTNAIEDPTQFQNNSNPQIIYIRLENEICFITSNFSIETEYCDPIIYDATSPNADGLNDLFIIENLINVYINFELSIYSRHGNIIYQGGNDEGLWDSISNRGLLFQGNIVPVGTYYYVLILNDSRYPEPFTGYVYVNY